MLLTQSATAVKGRWLRGILLGANAAFPALSILAGFPWPLVLLTVAAHGALFYALLLPQCGWLCPVVTRFRTRGREAWLTIDDGPNGIETVSLAQELKQRGVRATFFVKGARVDAHPEAVDALLEAGHGLANHTATHPIGRFWMLLPSRLCAEIDRCNESLRRAGAPCGRWFRAPLGAKNVFLQSELHRRGMRFVAWSVRGRDGIVCDPSAVSQRVARLASPGCIVLLHEGRRRSNEAILRSVDALLADGYSFVVPEDEQLQ